MCRSTRCNHLNYLTRELLQFSRRHGHAPVSLDHWRGSHTAGVHQFLQCIVGQWPPSATTGSPSGANCQAICAEYAQWLRERQGLERDFAPCVTAPTLYAFESIPSALSPDQIDAVMQTSRNDQSPKGLRDYAILLLLATYGMRAGEITRLQLNDIDWRADRIFVRHTKTGSQSILPLMPAVGEALLAYLRRGRPKTDVREIFIRRAPYRGFESGSSLYTSTRRRLDAAGVPPGGKRGPHAFRHAPAVSLLRDGTPMKIIGDVLGHRSASSTSVYLKLATADLRDVALEIPGLAEEDQS